MDCLWYLQNHIADCSVDLVFADPPFNIGKNYGENGDDALPDNLYLDWCKKWLVECVRVLKPGAALFLYNIPRWNLLLGSWLAERLAFRHWVAIDRTTSSPVKGKLLPSHYSLLYFTKGTPSKFHPPRIPIQTCRHCGGEIKDYGGHKSNFHPEGKTLTDVWLDIPPVSHKKLKHRSANELHMKLLDRIIDICTDTGDVIFDPFGGTGTTYVVSELKNRRWIGTEINDCAPILARFVHIEQERVFLEKTRENVNVLFTDEALRLRTENGFSNSEYNIGVVKKKKEKPLF